MLSTHAAYRDEESSFAIQHHALCFAVAPLVTLAPPISRTHRMPVSFHLGFEIYVAIAIWDPSQSKKHQLFVSIEFFSVCNGKKDVPSTRVALEVTVWAKTPQCLVK